MILTIIGALLGAVTNVVPGALKYFERKQELSHAIELTKLDMDKMRLANELNINLENVKADIGEGKSLHDHDSSIDGGRFFNALRASVRPVITYVFFFLFVAIKLAALYTLLNAGLAINLALPVIWDDNTAGLFAAILGFWFGSRTIDKFTNYGRKK